MQILISRRLLLLTIFLIYYQISLSAANSYLPIHISKHSKSSNPDGSEQNPYINVSDAFDRLQNLSDPTAQVDILLAPSIIPYNLSGYNCTLKNTQVDSIRISTWINEESVEAQVNPDQRAAFNLEFSEIRLNVISNITIEDVNVTSMNGFLNITNSSLIMQNIDIDVGFTSNWYFITLANSSNVVMTNVTVSMRSPRRLMNYINLQEDLCPSITIENISITSNFTYTTDQSSRLFNLVSSLQIPYGTVIVRNIDVKIANRRQRTLLQPFAFIRGFGYLGITNFTLDGQIISLPTYTSVIVTSFINNMLLNGVKLLNNQITGSRYSFLRAVDIAHLLIKNIKYSNNSLETHSKIKDFVLNELVDIADLKIENNVIRNNTFGNKTQFYKLSNSDESNKMQVQQTTLILTRIFMTDNTNDITDSEFSYLRIEEAIIRSLKVNVFLFSGNKLQGKILDIQNTVKSEERIFHPSFTPNVFTFTSMKIAYNLNVSNTIFLSFAPTHDQEEINGCLQPTELYLLEFNDLGVIGNSFIGGTLATGGLLYKISLLQTRQSQVHIKSSTIKDNQFYGYSFLVNGPKPSSLFITSSHFSNNSIMMSQFIVSTLIPGYSCVDFLYNNHQHGLTPLYRYSFIENTTFSDNEIKFAVMFTINNGFFALHNNTLTNITVFSGQLFGVNFLPYHINFNPLAYSRSKIIEESSLKSVEPARKLFSAIASKIAAYKEGNAYFVSFFQNNFKNITLINNAGSKFISISGFNFDQSFMNIEDNRFENFTYIQIMDIGNAPIIYIDTVKNLNILDNKLKSMNISSTFFSLSQPYVSHLLNVESNIVDECKMTAFLVFTANSITSLKFHNNEFKFVEVRSGLININIKYTTSDWIFSDNLFNRTTMMLDSKIFQMDQPGLIYISNTNAYTNTSMIWSNTFLDTVSTDIIQLGTTSQCNIFTIRTNQQVQFIDFNANSTTIFQSGSMIFVETPSSFLISNSTFQSIYSVGKDESIRVTSPGLYILNCKLDNFISTNSKGFLTFTNNADSSKIKILNSNFTRSYSMGEGSLLQVESSASNIQNLINTAVGMKSRLLNLDFQMVNCKATDVKRAIHFSKVNCSRCVIDYVLFSSSTLNNMVNLTGSTDGYFTIKNTNISTTVHGDPQPFLDVRDSFITVTLDNVTYRRDENTSYLAALNSGTLLLKNSNFTDVTYSGRGFIDILPPSDNLPEISRKQINPQVYIKNVSFINFTNTQPVKMLGIEWYPKSKASIISIAKQSNVYIVETLFKDINLMRAVLCHGAPATGNSTISIRSSTFDSLIAQTGPAVSVLPGPLLNEAKSIHLEVKDSVFTNTTAVLGGAIIAFNAKLDVSDSVFTNNNASDLGNSIFLGGILEANSLLRDNMFLNGMDDQKSPVKYDATDFKVSFLSDGKSIIRSTAMKKIDGWSAELFNVSHDISKGILNLQFVDAHDNEAVSYSSYAAVTVHISTNAKYHLPVSFDTRLINYTNSSMNISLSDVIIGGKASDIINMLVIYQTDVKMMEKFIVLNLRECLPGEYNNSVNCEVCAPNTYTLNPNHVCIDCPADANCIGQSSIHAKEGFWNAHPQSEKIYKCLDGRCLKHSSLGSCTEGYTGPMCNACDFDESYTESGFLRCGLCHNSGKSLLYTILIMFAYVGYQLFSIFIIYTGSKNLWSNEQDYIKVRKTERLFYIKSLLTYSQLVSILYLGSYEVYNSLGLFPQIGNPSTLITYGTQCSMMALGINSSDFLYYQIYFIVLSPVVELLIISFFASIIALFAKSISLKRLIAITAIYLTISNQPGIINNLGLFLSCGTLDGLDYKYIVSHPNWSCDTEQYSSFANFFVKPSLAIWSGAVPLVFLIILAANRKEFRDDKMKGSLGALMSGLRSKHYYWSIVDMALKLILSFLVFGIQQKNQVQIFLSLIALWTYQSMVKAIEPYKFKAFNTFCIILMHLLMFNIVVTQYLLDPANGQIVVILSLAAGIISNACFLLYLIWKVTSLTLLGLIAFFEKRVMKRRISRTTITMPPSRETTTSLLSDAKINN